MSFLETCLTCFKWGLFDRTGNSRVISQPVWYVKSRSWYFLRFSKLLVLIWFSNAQSFSARSDCSWLRRLSLAVSSCKMLAFSVMPGPSTMRRISSSIILQFQKKGRLFVISLFPSYLFWEWTLDPDSVSRKRNKGFTCFKLTWIYSEGLQMSGSSLHMLKCILHRRLCHCGNGRSRMMTEDNASSKKTIFEICNLLPGSSGKLPKQKCRIDRLLDRGL